MRKSCAFSRLQRAAVLEIAEHIGCVAGCTPDRFHRTQTSLDKKLQLAMLRPACKPSGSCPRVRAENDKHACVAEQLHIIHSLLEYRFVESGKRAALDL
jgi:hypothetical protein